MMSGNQRQTANDACGCYYSRILLIVLLFINDVSIISAGAVSNTSELITTKEVTNTINATTRGCNSAVITNDNNNENYIKCNQSNREIGDKSDKCNDCRKNSDNLSQEDTIESIEVSEPYGSKRVLSRRRRYLAFPSGSSFQVVYDQTLPIVALIDIFTIGVTVAIAWPLPDEPLYKIHEQILDKYKDIEKERIDQIKQELIQNKMDKVANVTQKPTKYFNQTLISNKFDPTKINKIFLSPLQWDKNDWNTVIKRIASIRNNHKVKPTSRQRYYPVFGKRSIKANYLNHEDMFYAHHHRESRQTLYGKITQFLNARGLDGMHCVLKALCETGQRANDHQPGTFLQEIMRAVFTIPEAVLGNEGVLPHHREYDEAHSEESNCAEKYKNCEHSIWDKNFWF